MKQINLTVLALLIGLFSFAQQTDSDAIVGNWYNQEKDGVVEIYKFGDRYTVKLFGWKLRMTKMETLKSII